MTLAASGVGSMNHFRSHLWRYVMPIKNYKSKVTLFEILGVTCLENKSAECPREAQMIRGGVMGSWEEETADNGHSKVTWKGRWLAWKVTITLAYPPLGHVWQMARSMYTWNTPLPFCDSWGYMHSRVLGAFSDLVQLNSSHSCTQAISWVAW